MFAPPRTANETPRKRLVRRVTTASPSIRRSSPNTSSDRSFTRTEARIRKGLVRSTRQSRRASNRSKQAMGARDTTRRNHASTRPNSVAHASARQARRCCDTIAIECDHVPAGGIFVGVPNKKRPVLIKHRSDRRGGLSANERGITQLAALRPCGPRPTSSTA